MHGKDDLETYVSMGSWIGGPVSLLPSWKKIVGSVIGPLLAVQYLGRIDDEVTEGESEAIVFPLNPDLWRIAPCQNSKTDCTKTFRVTLSVLEAKLNADTGNPTYIRIMSVLDLKKGV